MYRVLLYFAFFVFCSAAPYGDSATRILPVPERIIEKPVVFEQRDETDLVESTGSGYSYFRHQPIDARPLAEQKIAVDSLIKTDESFSDYTKASAFKSEVIPNTPFGTALNTKVFPEERFIAREGYGQDKFIPPPPVKVIDNGYGAKKFVDEKIIVKDNGYGAKLPETRFIAREGYGQDKFIPPPPVRVIDNGYGAKQIVEEKVIIKDNGYGAKLPETRFIAREGYGQDKFIPPPPIKVIDNGYGAKKFVEEKVIIKDNGYGAKVFPEARVIAREGYGQDKFIPPPPVRVIDNGYGAKKFVEEKVIVKDNGYGAKILPETRVIAREGYGQEKLIPAPIKIVGNRY